MNGFKRFFVGKVDSFLIVKTGGLGLNARAIYLSDKVIPKELDLDLSDHFPRVNAFIFEKCGLMNEWKALLANFAN